jgi:hypothetical protein
MLYYRLILTAVLDGELLYEEDIDAVNDDIAAMLAEDAVRASPESLPWKCALLTGPAGEVVWQLFRED